MSCGFCVKNEFGATEQMDGFRIDPAMKFYPAELDVEFDGCYCCNSGTKSMKIYYCPMCGRKLQEG